MWQSNISTEIDAQGLTQNLAILFQYRKASSGIKNTVEYFTLTGEIFKTFLSRTWADSVV